MAAEQHQGHAAGRQGIKQLLGGHDVAAHGSGAVGLQQFFGAHVVAVDQPLASGELGQCCLGFGAAPLQIRLDPLLLAPWQELGLQISDGIQLIAEQEPLGLAAQQGMQQGHGGEGGSAGDGDRSRACSRHWAWGSALRFSKHWGSAGAAGF
jgi:hypothetical protein